MKILEDRFGRKELIVDFHMNRLLNLTPVRKLFHVIALRNLYDQLEINITGLKSLEISPDFYSSLVSDNYEKAIPPDLALEYNKNHTENQSQITDLIAYLRSEVESRERSEFLIKPHDSQLKNNNSYSNAKYFERTSHNYPQSNRRVQEKSKQNSHLDLEKKNVDVKTTSSNSVFHNRGGVLLQCVKAEIIGRSSSDKIFCLFDNGSSDFYWSLTYRIKRLDSSLVAVETRLGWSLQGKCDERSDCTSVNLVHSEEELISTELRRFWEIESLGILDKGSMTLDFRDRDFTLFFWTDNLNNESYVLNFTRVLFGLRPSPYLLAATLKHHFKKYKEQYPHTFELLNSSIYVDDLICGQNDVPNALRTTLECLQIFSDAGMLLHKWRSNSKQLSLLWQQGVKTESSETSAIDLRPPTKVLGLAWDPENYLIYFYPQRIY
ncbi:DUF1758 domain-containing protein [Trichonephila clavipes]|uniref:DUF1758 domain-containing protein n=1 Tax=Trichonephila clavipes TaxID=2585209 RepID=A0A8X6VQ29_TRICX|nr:DUF1758 domain-containing protein [Trichonephila clavipes]